MITARLSPPLLYDIGLEEAVRELLKEVKREHGLNCYYEQDGGASLVDGQIRILLFESIRELISNVTEHARARNIWINISRGEGGLEVVVEDDGVGFDMLSIMTSQHPGNGLGLINLRERLSYIGGHLDIQSEPGNGTRVTIIAPFGEGRSAETIP